MINDKRFSNCKFTIREAVNGNISFFSWLCFFTVWKLYVEIKIKIESRLHCIDLWRQTKDRSSGGVTDKGILALIVRLEANIISPSPRLQTQDFVIKTRTIRDTVLPVLEQLQFLNLNLEWYIIFIIVHCSTGYLENYPCMHYMQIYSKQLKHWYEKSTVNDLLDIKHFKIHFVRFFSSRYVCNIYRCPF